MGVSLKKEQGIYMAFKLNFLGAASTVTGSKYLLTHAENNILIDCGLFQGLKALRLQNWEVFPFPPAEIKAIILTHAHIDHSGYIPRLIKEGFRGKIYCTPATKDLCRILLTDSGRLMEEEADFLNRHKKTKHHPALPFFSEEDAEKAMNFFETLPFEEEKNIAPGLSFNFRYVGHILGAASAVVSVDNKKIAFTGDIGRRNDSILFPPKPLPDVDYLVTESTYGNRLHSQIDPSLELLEAIQNVLKNNGVVMIPSFAVGRAQSLMFALSVLKEKKLIGEFPMYLNSPMAANVSDLFLKHRNLHKLDETECKNMGKDFRYIQSVEESKSLNEKKGPLLIIAGSGMITGGRILHHLKAFASNPDNLILLTGYQTPGTRGRALMDNARELKIHGEYIPIAAQIKILNNYSAHADYAEIIEWFSLSAIHPKKVFITHGEPSAADELRRRLFEKFQWNCVVPSRNDIVELD